MKHIATCDCWKPCTRTRASRSAAWPSKLGIALGLANIYLKRMIHKGYIKCVNVQPNRISYLITPRGIAEKARLTYEFMDYSLHLYGEVRQHLREAMQDCAAAGKRVAIYGSGEAAELAYLSLKESGLEPVAIFDQDGGHDFLGMPVRADRRARRGRVRPDDRRDARSIGTALSRSAAASACRATSCSRCARIRSRAPKRARAATVRSRTTNGKHSARSLRFMALTNKRICITGGAGFIGSHLVSRPRRRTTRSSSTTTCIATRCSSRTSKGTSTCTSSRVTCSTSTATRKAIDGCQIVIHCAAIAGVYTVDRSAVRTMEVNLLGTHQVVKAALEVGVERFVEFSTSEVYGSFIHKGKEDDFTPIGPIGESRWVYAASKLASEHLSYAHYREDKLPLAIVRPFNVYGPRQVGDGAIRGMTLQALQRPADHALQRRHADPLVVLRVGLRRRRAALLREPGGDRPRVQHRQPAGHGHQLRAREPDHPADQLEVGDRLQAASRPGSRAARAGDREGDDAARLTGRRCRWKPASSQAIAWYREQLRRGDRQDSLDDDACVVTGASGFIGHNVLLRAPREWDIVAVYHSTPGLEAFVEAARPDQCHGRCSAIC